MKEKYKELIRIINWNLRSSYSIAASSWVQTSVCMWAIQGDFFVVYLRSSGEVQRYELKSGHDHLLADAFKIIY